MPPISEWQSLFSLQAGAAATLTGLVFVAVSINLTRIIAYPGLPSRAAESIVQFLQVFFICTAALIPQQPTALFAAEVLTVSGFSWIMQVIVQIRYARSRSGHPKLWLMIRVVQTQFASVPFFIAGFYLVRSSAAGLYWLIPGFVFSFIAGVANAWVLLVEVVR